MSLKSMNDKSVLITGAAGGMGREYAGQLVEQGANVILTDIDECSLENVIKALPVGPGKALGKIACDISTPCDGIINELDDFPTDPGESVDTDNDGIGNNSDDDDDGDDLSDALETGFFLTNPLLVDSDGDGLVDGYDGVVLLAELPGGVDFNGDGYVDGELGLGTEPTDPDSDDDTFSDGEEIAAGTDPLDPLDLPVTVDGNVAPRGNIDNEVNAADYLVMMRFVLGLETPDGLEIARGDLDGSGVIDLPDLILLMQIIQAAP